MAFAVVGFCCIFSQPICVHMRISIIHLSLGFQRLDFEMITRLANPRGEYNQQAHTSASSIADSTAHREA